MTDARPPGDVLEEALSYLCDCGTEIYDGARREKEGRAALAALTEQLQQERDRAERAEEALRQIQQTPCDHGYEAEPERLDCACGACQNERIATIALAAAEERE